ncbi:hypothetical protein ACFYRC_36055 [Streptomyces sp. NPDC005279]|uniref:hypothetical protein n=1 Tax=Streptomyces sp. NPDC005279 TaxID=3364712 RepID=UPI00367EB2ED
MPERYDGHAEIITRGLVRPAVIRRAVGGVPGPQRRDPAGEFAAPIVTGRR